ncbi:MAG: hypothetical protein ACK56F_04770, partial [bacterium]
YISRQVKASLNSVWCPPFDFCILWWKSTRIVNTLTRRPSVLMRSGAIFVPIGKFTGLSGPIYHLSVVVTLFIPPSPGRFKVEPTEKSKSRTLSRTGFY